jgi:hypothetical protein
MPVWHSAGDAFSPGAPSEAASHVGRRPSLIQKHQLDGIKLPLLLGPGGAGCRHVWTFLFGGAQDFF